MQAQRKTTDLTPRENEADTAKNYIGVLLEEESYKSNFRTELVWIASDQAKEFEDELRIPIRNREFFQENAREYFEFRSTLPPDTDVRIGDQAFDDMLETLRKHGENPERLILWHASMQDHLTPFGQPREIQSIAPFYAWKRVLYAWARGWGGIPKHLSVDRFDAFAATYRKHVVEPSNAFDHRIEQSEKLWLAGNRSKLDDYLWDLYFEDQDAAPSLFFKVEMKVVYFRRWWRAHRTFLSAPEKELLFADFTDHIQADGGNFEFIDWGDVQPIDQAIDIDNIPDFDRLKRDW